MDTIRWGVIATGQDRPLVRRRSRRRPGATIAAVGSRRLRPPRRSPARTATTPRAYGRYEEVAEDPDVDVVYVANPHAFHPDNVRTCFEAGKAVLCEKPLTLNAADAGARRGRGPSSAACSSWRPCGCAATRRSALSRTWSPAARSAT